MTKLVNILSFGIKDTLLHKEVLQKRATCVHVIKAHVILNIIYVFGKVLLLFFTCHTEMQRTLVREREREGYTYKNECNSLFQYQIIKVGTISSVKMIGKII